MCSKAEARIAQPAGRIGDPNLQNRTLGKRRDALAHGSIKVFGRSVDVLRCQQLQRDVDRGEESVALDRGYVGELRRAIRGLDDGALAGIRFSMEELPPVQRGKNQRRENQSPRFPPTWQPNRERLGKHRAVPSSLFDQREF